MVCSYWCANPSRYLHPIIHVCLTWTVNWACPVTGFHEDLHLHAEGGNGVERCKVLTGLQDSSPSFLISQRYEQSWPPAPPDPLTSSRQPARQVRHIQKLRSHWWLFFFLKIIPLFLAREQTPSVVRRRCMISSSFSILKPELIIVWR